MTKDKYVRRITDHLIFNMNVHPVEGGWVSWPVHPWEPGHFYPNTHWELVPEERWETITDACIIWHFEGQQVINFQGEEIGRMQRGYRLASLRIERLVCDSPGRGETHD